MQYLATVFKLRVIETMDYQDADNKLLGKNFKQKDDKKFGINDHSMSCLLFSLRVCLEAT